jgi:hypothetical protein
MVDGIGLKNKKAWIKIVEAFIAIMLIVSAFIVIMNRQKNQSNLEEQINSLQDSILASISKDNYLRSQVLIREEGEIEDYVGEMVPSSFNYKVRICDYQDLCSLGTNIDGTVYSDEILIVANLTYYPSGNMTKLKLFMWRK